MKKIVLTLVILLGVVITASAQGKADGFFYSNIDNNYRYIDPSSGQELPDLPTYGYGDQSAQAPLGSGLLVLTALGAGYAVSRRRKK